MPVLAEVARAVGVGEDAVAIAAVLGQPWADVVLSGASSAEMLASNLAAQGIELDEDALSRLDGLREEPEEYWRIRSALPWN